MEKSVLLEQISSPPQELIKTALQLSWPDYHQLINELPRNFQIAPSLQLLNIADEQLNQSKDFAESQVSERYLLGGVQDTATCKRYPFDPQLLGDMQSFASFKKLLRNDPAGLAKLFKIIPTTGPIDGWHFMQFIDAYQNLFATHGFKQTHLFPATRLLCMKRPDQFVVLSDASSEVYRLALNIKPFKKQDFQRYWDELIVPIQQTQWFKTFQPLDLSQLPLHRVRVALLNRLATSPLSSEQLTSVEMVTSTQLNTTADNEENSDNLEVINEEKASNKPPTLGFMTKERQPSVKKPAVQPKKLTIGNLKSAAGSKSAATKLMSQYYFANKDKFAKVDIKKHRDSIIERVAQGESVEQVFSELLN